MNDKIEDNDEKRIRPKRILTGLDNVTLDIFVDNVGNMSFDISIPGINNIGSGTFNQDAEKDIKTILNRENVDFAKVLKVMGVPDHILDMASGMKIPEVPTTDKDKSHVFRCITCNEIVPITDEDYTFSYVGGNMNSINFEEKWVNLLNDLRCCCDKPDYKLDEKCKNSHDGECDCKPDGDDDKRKKVRIEVK